jgi:predicted esterase
MSKALCIVLVFLFILFLPHAVRAQDNPTPGQVTTVTCKHDSGQRYACYVPSKYSAKKKWPVLYCFSPGGDGMSFVRLFKDVCERQGWIVVGSNNARNGPGPPIIAATKAMWKDTHARFSINDKRCYSSGFSGGSGMAFDMAQAFPDNWAGVIPMAVANSWAENTPPIKKHIAVYFIIGEQDAVQYVRKHAEALKARGNKAEVKTFPGGHTLPPKNVAEGAVDWLVSVAPKGSTAAAAGKAQKPTQLTLREDLAKRLQTAVRKAARGDLGGALRLAQRVLEDERAEEDEKSDAKYIKEEIEKRAEELFAEAEGLLKEKKPYEARELLDEIRKAFADMEQANKAVEKIAALDDDESLREELAAGKLFVKALSYEERGKKDQARKYFELVIEKYPDTEYARRAGEKK